MLVFQFCLGVLQLLGFFGVVYYPTIHRVTTTESFVLGFSVVVPLALLAASWVGYHVWSGDRGRLSAGVLLLVAGFSGEEIDGLDLTMGDE